MTKETRTVLVQFSELVAEMKEELSVCRKQLATCESVKTDYNSLISELLALEEKYAWLETNDNSSQKPFRILKNIDGILSIVDGNEELIQEAFGDE